MNRQTLAAAQTEIQFLLSLLNITAPGHSGSQQAAAIEQLLPVTSNPR